MFEMQTADQQPIATTSAAQEQQQRAIAQVQAMVMVAHARNRDEDLARDKILKACTRESMANNARFSYPRGKEIVSDGSIDLARMMAQKWGNIDYGWKMIRQDMVEGYTECEAYAWDIENNARYPIQFTVQHWRETSQLDPKTGRKGYKLTSDRDIYELCANMASRRLRTCIFNVIPADIKEDALAACDRVVSEIANAVNASEANKKAHQETISKMLSAFNKDYKVTNQHISTHLGKAVTEITPEDVITLKRLYQAFKNGEQEPSEVFAVEPAPGVPKPAENDGQTDINPSYKTAWDTFVKSLEDCTTKDEVNVKWSAMTADVKKALKGPYDKLLGNFPDSPK